MMFKRYWPDSWLSWAGDHHARASSERVSGLFAPSSRHTSPFRLHRHAPQTHISPSNTPLEHTQSFVLHHIQRALNRSLWMNGWSAGGAREGRLPTTHQHVAEYSPGQKWPTQWTVFTLLILCTVSSTGHCLLFHSCSLYLVGRVPLTLYAHYQFPWGKVNVY